MSGIVTADSKIFRIFAKNNKWRKWTVAKLSTDKTLHQCFPTGVPCHPRVPFTILRGAMVARKKTFSNTSLQIHFQNIIKSKSKLLWVTAAKFYFFPVGCRKPKNVGKHCFALTHWELKSTTSMHTATALQIMFFGNTYDQLHENTTKILK